MISEGVDIKATCVLVYSCERAYGACIPSSYQVESSELPGRWTTRAPMW